MLMSLKQIFILLLVTSIRGLSFLPLFAQGQGLAETLWQVPSGSLSHIVSVSDSALSGKAGQISLQLPSSSQWLGGSYGNRQIEVSELPAVQTVCKSTGVCNSVLFVPDSSHINTPSFLSEASFLLEGRAAANFQPSLLPIINTGVSGAFNIELFEAGVIARLTQWLNRPGEEASYPLAVTLQTASGVTVQQLPLQPLIEVLPHSSGIISRGDFSMAKLLVEEKKAGSRPVLKLIPAPRLVLKEDELYQADNLFAEEGIIKLSDDLVTESEDPGSLWFLDDEDDELIRFLEEAYKGKVVRVQNSHNNAVAYMIHLSNGTTKWLTQDDARKEMELDNTTKTSFAESPPDATVPDDLKFNTAGGDNVDFAKLLDDLKSFRADWGDLGFVMDYSIDDIDAIDADSRGNCEQGLKLLIKKWAGDGADWDKLLNAIRKFKRADLNKIVTNIEQNGCKYYMIGFDQLSASASASVPQKTQQSEEAQLFGVQIRSLQKSLRESETNLETAYRNIAKLNKMSEEYQEQLSKLETEYRRLKCEVLATRSESEEKIQQINTIIQRMELQLAQKQGSSEITSTVPAVSSPATQENINIPDVFYETEVRMFILMKTVNYYVQNYWSIIALAFDVGQEKIDSIEIEQHKLSGRIRSVWNYLIGRGKLKNYGQIVEKLNELKQMGCKIPLADIVENLQYELAKK